MKIHSWLKKRPIRTNISTEFQNLCEIEDGTLFSDISVKLLEKYFHKYPRNDFYRIIRLLGFYGMIYFGRLSSYSGPNEEYPEVIFIPENYWKEKLTDNIKLTALLNSCGLFYLGHLNGVPIKSFYKLTGNEFDETLFPPAIVIRVKENFFSINEKIVNCQSDQNIELFSENERKAPKFQDSERIYSSIPIEQLNFTVRSLNCLKSSNINYLEELVQKSGTDLLSIKKFGRNSLIEIIEKLNSMGLRLGIWIEEYNNTKTIDQNKNGIYNYVKGPVRWREIIHSGKKIDYEKLCRLIKGLTLSVRSETCLNEQKIEYVWQLVQLQENDLLKVKNLGKKSLKEIKELISKLALQFGQIFSVEQLVQLQSYKPSEVKIDYEKLSRPIKDFPLGVRSKNCLNEQKIEYVWQLIQLNESSLLKLKNMGKKSLSEIKNIIINMGLEFGQDFTAAQIEGIQSYKPVIDGETINGWLKKTVQELTYHPLDYLRNKEKIIIIKRVWGIEKKKLTLEEIAKEFGITRERVRQLEKKALNKIKQQFSRELRETNQLLQGQLKETGPVANLSDINIDLCGLSQHEEVIAGCLIGLEENNIYIDWELRLISLEGEALMDQICKEIKDDIISKTEDGFFDKHQLEQVVKKINKHYGIFKDQKCHNLIKKLFKNQNIQQDGRLLYFGSIRKIDKMAFAFKEFFPKGLEIYQKHDDLLACIKQYDVMMFKDATHRSVCARLTDHPSVLLWGRGFFIHKDNISYDLKIVKKIEIWIINRFEKGYYKFQINAPYLKFREQLNDSGIPNKYALYTLLRSENNPRILQQKFPTIIDSDAGVDLNEGILQEIENYFIEQEKAVPFAEIKKEFVEKRGWNEYSVQQNMSVHSDLIFPWKNQSYIHIDCLKVNYTKLQELIDALYQKVYEIKAPYNLKGAKKDMRILWEQVCPSASTRAIAKLIRQNNPENLIIKRNFILIADMDDAFMSTGEELDEYFFEACCEKSKYELNEEFCEKRGWSEQQLYGAIQKASLFKSSKNSFIHPATINWNEFLSQNLHEVLSKYLRETNNNNQPHMQIEELICKFVLPELPNGIEWSRQLVKSAGEEIGDFLFFGDAYAFVDNDFDIDDLDDMIAYLIGKNFKYGIARRQNVEELLWREGIIVSGRKIPMDQFFPDSSIQFNADSDEVELSQIGIERYARNK